MNINSGRIKTMESQRYKVVKHNEIIQRSKFRLSAPEQKTVAFLISLIKPKEEYLNNVQPLEYEFEIQDYCKICDIAYNGGANYKMVRENLKYLRDKSINITLPSGIDTSISWINKYWSNKGKGTAKIRFDEDMAPYIFGVCENTTRYELLNILPMQSKYSIRLYEICRSWSGIHSKKYALADLRTVLGVLEDELVRYPDFKRKVLDISQREINQHTDINVEFEPILKGRKTIAILIHIKKK